MSLSESEVTALEGAGQSLDNRMGRRAEALAVQQTEWFPIPGWEDMLEVELRSLGYKTMSAIQHANQKVRDPGTQELYNMADQLLRATEGFREVPEDDPDGERIPLLDDWTSLAARLGRQNLSPRQALLVIVDEKRIHFLVQEWAQWARSVRADIDKETAEDFVRTG